MDINGKTPAGQADSSPVDQPVDSPAPSTDVTAQLAALEAEKAQLSDMLLRRQADYENFRRRAEREKQELRETASQDAAAALLPILDDFERALKAAPTAEADSPAMREYVKGMELIYQRLLDTLAKLGLEAIQAVGQPFDPNIHNAIQREARDDVADQTVIEEYQRGYLFKGRLLRAAMVKVAVSS
jgi:molecular chaperone GrpE